MELATERLVLRPFALADADALTALWRDPDVRRYLWDDRLVTGDETLDAIHRSDELWRSHGCGQFTIRLRDSSELIGFAGLFSMDEGPEIELIYGLAPAYWKAGYATEASRAVLDFVFGNLAIERLVARTDRPNVASAGVMRRLGMRDITRDDDPYIVYALDRADYLRLQA